METAADIYNENGSGSSAKFPLYARIIAYSFLQTDEILIKASKICKIDRKKIRGSELISNNRQFTLKISYGDIEQLKILEAHSWQLLNIVSELKIQLHLINTLYAQKAEYLAHFIVNLPPKFNFHSISLSVNVQPTGLNYD